MSSQTRQFRIVIGRSDSGPIRIPEVGNRGALHRRDRQDEHERERPRTRFVDVLPSINWRRRSFGIEYDGQVMAEGQTGQTSGGSGGAGFNVNWDADWTVRAQITERGWEAEFAIPLRTLRYNPGQERTWGLNAMRNIRRKNEQVFLAPVGEPTLWRLSET